MKTFKTYITETGLSEGKLTPKELRKTFKTTGYLRVTAFADKMWNKEKFEKVGGGGGATAAGSAASTTIITTIYFY